VAVDAATGELISRLHALHREGRFREGIDLVEQALRADPDSALLHYNLGVFRGSLGDHQGAIEAFWKELDRDPAHVGSHRALANAFTELGQIEDSIPHLERCLAADLSDSACRRLLGRNLSSLGRLDDAVVHLQQAAGELADAPSFFELGLAQRRLGDSEAASGNFARALAADPEHLPTLLNYGQVLAARGRTSDGEALLALHRELAELGDRVDALEREARRRDTRPELFLALAELYHQRGDQAAAERTYRRALDRLPDMAPAALGLAAILLQTGRAGEAAAWVEELQAAEPANAAVLFLVGTLHLEQGSPEEADRAFAASQRVLPWPSAIFADLGATYQRLSDPAQAAASYSEAVVRDPRHAGALLGLAEALASLGREAEARDAALRAVEIEPRLGDAWTLLGILDFRSGDQAAAERAFIRALGTRRPLLLQAGGSERLLEDFEQRSGSEPARELFERVLRGFGQ
jgi:tetratricopeptide (TPR) repeat protein